MRTLLCQMAPTENGILLATDVYLPGGAPWAPGPFPTILVRTPYHRTGMVAEARSFVARGYAFVVQDCRGKYDSQGQFTPLVHEKVDGQAALDWTANQRWCNGRIGLWGRSYLGIVQIPAASGGHEALRCIAPSVAPGSFFRDWLRYDGCFALGNAIRWSLTHATSITQPVQDYIPWDELHKQADPEAIADRAGFATPILAEWGARDCYDDYWEALDQDLLHECIRVPGLHSGGWFDHLTRGQFDAYRNIRDRGATPQARTGQRLLIGPWGHRTMSGSGPDRCHYGEWDFGQDADLPVLAHELQFYDYHLKQIDNGFTAQPPVKVFLMGDNRWVYLDDWPPSDVQMQHWWLTSGGSANMGTGDGELRHGLEGSPPDHDRSDSYRYDPHDPVPTLGGAVYWGLDARGPMDQRPLLDRTDILCYRSPRLEEPLAVVGELTLDLTVCSDAVDTDFVAKFCVEEPSGAVTVLTLGSLRCRYRNSWRDPEPLTPGEATPIQLHMGHLAYRFPAASRIVLLVTSSDFPRIQPHTNTMAPPWSGDAAVPAHNSVLHGPGAPSCLHVPVMEL